MKKNTEPPLQSAKNHQPQKIHLGHGDHQEMIHMTDPEEHPAQNKEETNKTGDRSKPELQAVPDHPLQITAVHLQFQQHQRSLLQIEKSI
jgi:hypothetical protein